MKSMSTTEAQKNFGNLVAEATKEPVSITKHMKEVFVVVPSETFHELKRRSAHYEQQQQKPTGLRQFIGAGRDYSRFSSMEEVDRFINQHRETWQI